MSTFPAVRQLTLHRSHRWRRMQGFQADRAQSPQAGRNEWGRAAWPGSIHVSDQVNECARPNAREWRVRQRCALRLSKAPRFASALDPLSTTYGWLRTGSGGPVGEGPASPAYMHQTHVDPEARFPSLGRGLTTSVPRARWSCTCSGVCSTTGRGDPCRASARALFMVHAAPRPDRTPGRCFILPGRCRSPAAARLYRLESLWTPCAGCVFATLVV